jgi:hypothetical protein
MTEIKKLAKIAEINPAVQADIPHVPQVRSDVLSLLSEADAIEEKKDRLDLRPNIDFVEKNIGYFEDGFAEMLNRKVTKEAKKWVEGVKFKGEEDVVKPQVMPEECRSILMRMPESLREISKLERVNYHLFDSGINLIPVPGYDENGNFVSAEVESVYPKDFPRIKSLPYLVYRWRKSDDLYKFTGKLETAEESDHPSRVLVGVSNGREIFPTPLTSHVHENGRARYLYQVHVFLHEFFHTVDYVRRSPEERAKISLEVDGQEFTFQEWWEAFEELILSGIEPGCISSYANTYAGDLNQETKDNDYKKFTAALAEQICETFVAYQLGIIANDDGWKEFKSESFGNTKQLEKYIMSEANSANLKWLLMDKLCRAKVLSTHNS